MSSLAQTLYDKDKGRHVVNISKEALEWLALPVKDEPWALMVVECHLDCLWAWTTDSHRVHAVKLGNFARPIDRFVLPVCRLVWELKFGHETGIALSIFDSLQLSEEDGTFFNVVHATYKAQQTRHLRLEQKDDHNIQGWKVVPHRVEFGRGELPEALNSEYLAQAAKMVGNRIHIGMGERQDTASPFVVASHSTSNLHNCDWFAVLMEMQPSLPFAEKELWDIEATVGSFQDAAESDQAILDDVTQYHDAVAFAREHGEVSTSMLQRKFSIGFKAASGLVDRMEAEGIIGPRDGPRPRQVIKPAPEPPRRKKAYPEAQG